MNDLPFSLSQTAERLPRSMMRELIGLIHKPGIISFAAGLPAVEALPLAQFQTCLGMVLRQEGPKALQYGPPYAPLQAWLAGYMGQFGISCSPEQIFITNGAQYGLNLLTQILLNPGDGAIIEEVTFTGIYQALLKQGARIHTIPTDLETGADIAALEATLKIQPRPRLIILIPDFHNPLGVSLSLEKRRQIVALAQEYQVAVIEDNPYAPLVFEGEPKPPLRALDGSGRVIYSGSFSKMLAPAMRLGWLVVPEALATRLTVLRETIDLESSALMQRAVFAFLDQGYLGSHLDRLNTLNRRRRDVMIQALEIHLAGLELVRWTVPQGGIFIWLSLPEGLDTWAMLETAVARNVAYVPGRTFAVHGGYEHTMRLNFSNLPPAQIETGVARLARVIKEAYAQS